MASDTWVDPVTGNYMQEREDGSVLEDLEKAING